MDDATFPPCGHACSAYGAYGARMGEPRPLWRRPGPRALVPCLLSQGKAIRRVPNPWGPRPIAKYGTFGSLEGRARGKGQGFLEHPLVGWGLEGLGW